MLTDQIVYCDSLEWDGFWASVLFKDTAIPQEFEIKDIKDLLEKEEGKISTYQSKKKELEKSGNFKLHSALDDAQIIWQSLNS